MQRQIWCKTWLLAAALAAYHLCLAQKLMLFSAATQGSLKWCGILRKSYTLPACLPFQRPCELCKPEELGKALPLLPMAQASCYFGKRWVSPKYFFTICWQYSSGNNSHRSLCSFFVPPTSPISQKHLTQPQFLHMGRKGRCSGDRDCKFAFGSKAYGMQVATGNQCHGMLSCTCT